MITQPTLVRLRVPIKIYGDLHGRFGGIFLIFRSYKIILNVWNAK